MPNFAFDQTPLPPSLSPSAPSLGATLQWVQLCPSLRRLDVSGARNARLGAQILPLLDVLKTNNVLSAPRAWDRPLLGVRGASAGEWERARHGGEEGDGGVEGGG